MTRGVRFTTLALLLLVPGVRGGWRARWLASPPPIVTALPPVIGEPLPGAADVRLVRALLRSVPSDAAVDVFVDTVRVPDERSRYLAYQLLHLEYPRLLWVGQPPKEGAGSAEWQVFGPDVEPSAELSAVDTAGPYRLFRRDRW